MTQQLTQPSLSGGELSPTLWGHVDLARYATSVALARNWMVWLGGGMRNRPGTQFISHCANDAKRSRLVPFVFNQDQAYVVELSDKVVRIVRDGSLLNTQVPVSNGAVGTGDGVTSVFNVSEPGPITVSSVTRNDWQGTQTLQPTPRQNKCYSSEIASDWNSSTGMSSVVGATAGPRPGSLADSLVYNGSGSAGGYRVGCPIGYIGASIGVCSLWLKAASATTIVLQDAGGNSLTCNLTTSWQRFSISGSSAASSYQIGIYSPVGVNTAFTIYAFGCMVEPGNVVNAYIPAPYRSIGPVITDYAYTPAGAFTFGEVPLTGAALVWNGSYTTTSGLTLASPYASSDLPSLSWTQSNDVLTLFHPNYLPYQLSRLSESSWTFAAQEFDSGPFQDQNVDQSVTVNPNAAVGSVTLAASTALFLNATVGQLFKLAEVQTQPPWAAAVAVTAGNIRRSDGKNYIALNSATTGPSNPTVTSGTWNDGGVTWQYMDSGFGVVRLTSIAGDGRSAVGTVLAQLPTSVVVTLGSAKTISGFGPFISMGFFKVVAHGLVAGQTFSWDLNYLDLSSNVRRLTGTATVNQVVDANNFNSFSTLFRVPAGFATFTSGTIQAGTVVTSSSPTYRWSLGAWSDALGYPSCGTYYQQRLVTGGSKTFPQTLWASRTSAYGDFSTSNPIQDDDALTFTFSSGQENPLVSLLPLGQLIALSSSAAWVVGSYTQSPLTPGNLSARIQAYNGGALGVPILGVDSAALFLQAHGQTVRGFGYSYQYAYDNYSPANNLSIHASHLFDGHAIQEWAFHQVPYSRVWAVRDDGLLLGFTYNNEQQIAAWDRHDSAGGLFESVCVIPEGGEDVLYVAVQRTVNGATVRHIERMSTRVVTDIAAGVFLDASLSFDGRNTSTQTVTISGGTTWDQHDAVTVTASSQLFNTPKALVGDQIAFTLSDGSVLRLTVNSITSNTVATGIPSKLIPVDHRSVARTDWAWAPAKVGGLTHLIGQTVGVLGDGNVLTPQTVANDGTITLTVPAVRVCAGLQYDQDIQTLGVVFGPPDAGLGHVKAINAVRLVVSASSALMVGRDADHLVLVKQRGFQPYDAPDGLVTGIQSVGIQTSWSADGSVFIRNAAPLPVTLTAIIPEVSMGGSVG